MRNAKECHQFNTYFIRSIQSSSGLLELVDIEGSIAVVESIVEEFLDIQVSVLKLVDIAQASAPSLVETVPVSAQVLSIPPIEEKRLHLVPSTNLFYLGLQTAMAKSWY